MCAFILPIPSWLVDVACIHMSSGFNQREYALRLSAVISVVRAFKGPLILAGHNIQRIDWAFMTCGPVGAERSSIWWLHLSTLCQHIGKCTGYGLGHIPALLDLARLHQINQFAEIWRLVPLTKTDDSRVRITLGICQPKQKRNFSDMILHQFQARVTKLT